MKREFYIDTPIGKIRVWAKHDKDSPENFPGVYIDIVQNEGDYGDMLACIEYESIDKVIQTCVYQPGYDEPVNIIKHII